MFTLLQLKCLQNGYCFINNSCVGDGATNTINNCDICNTTKSKYDWSYNEGTENKNLFSIYITISIKVIPFTEN